MLDRVLYTAEDFVPVGKGSTPDKVRVAFPLKGDLAEHYFKQSVSNPEHKNVKGFNRTWRFNKETGLIEGSSTILGVRFDENLRPDGFSMLSVEEARMLDDQDKFSGGGYRNLGLAVFGEGNPNSEIAKEILFQGKEIRLPLLIPFSALTHRVDSNFPYGVALSLTNEAQRLKSGEEARKILEQFDEVGDSGAQRVFSRSTGFLSAKWNYLDDSNFGGRMDWISYEVPVGDLKVAYRGLMERTYQIQKLTQERDAKSEAFAESLENLF